MLLSRRALPMSIAVQVLRLSTVALAATLALVFWRGVPQVARPESASAAACHAPVAGQSDGVGWISQDMARALSAAPGVAFVDCRPESEYEAGHVAGSLHVAGDTPSTGALQQLAGARTVIAYCDADHGCARSVEVASKLRQAGVGDVRVLEGGMPDWLQRGYPAESGVCGQCEATP
jgi:rhodanese-related sulfurtransferase